MLPTSLIKLVNFIHFMLIFLNIKLSAASSTGRKRLRTGVAAATFLDLQFKL